MDTRKTYTHAYTHTSEDTMKPHQPMNPNRITLYMNATRRAEFDRAAEQLRAEGYTDAYKVDGSVNVSGVITALIKKYLTPTD